MAIDERNDLDKVLDAAMSGYSAQEPWPGLEDRILNRIRTEGTRSRSPLFRWVGILAVAACVLLVAVLLRREADPRSIALAPTPPAELPRAKPEAPKVIQAPPLRPKPEPRRQVAERAPIPKRQVFPTPAPLTAEERALLALVTRGPERTREALTYAQTGAPKPIQIEPIEIQELQNSPQ